MHSRRIPLAVALLLAAAASLPAEAQLKPKSSFKIPADPAQEFSAPENVAEPPAEAQRTPGGVAWIRLNDAVAMPERPGPTDAVSIRYTGWTTDGRMFDTTERDERPRRFRVTQVIPGFQEAVRQLSVGEQARFWVPEELAYAGQAGKPQGMLVFDLLLTEIVHGPKVPQGIAAPPEDAQRSESGLAWTVLEVARDEEAVPPGPEATMQVHFDSWTTDGRLLDSTSYTGEAQTFTMSLVIEGFREALSTMVPGERRRLWIPPELTELDGRKIHDDTVVVDLRLLSYLSPPERPDDVSFVPDDVQRSVSGLAWRVLREGTGELKPKFGDTVEVVYAAWTADGRKFDSAYDHGRPGRFKLDALQPPGFNEALFGMVAGEKRRIWIPEDLAFGGQQGRPQGMLVFEIELLAVEPASVDGAGGSS